MKVVLLAISMVIVPLSLAAAASASWSCGDAASVGLDTCGGDTNTDNPYAGCDGRWRDVFIEGSYYQVCVGSSAHVWACPNSSSYGTSSPACEHVAA